MVCARAYLIASSMTLLTCNLSLFVGKKPSKKRTVVWPRDGCSATSSSSYYSKPQNQKKKVQKKIHKRMMRKMRKMRRRIFLSFFIYMAYERDVDFLMLFLVFGFLRAYVLVIDDFFLWYLWNTRTTLILLTTTALRSHRSTSGWRGRRFHEGRRQRKSLSALSSPIGTALTGFD